MHFNWSENCRPNGEAPQHLFDYYSGVYELAPEQWEKLWNTKTECIAEWQSDLALGAQPLHVSVEKLKPGTGSSDGTTTEVLRQMDDSNLEAMAAALDHLFLNSTLPQSRSSISSTLVPKMAVPTGPEDFRPNAASVTLRKFGGKFVLAPYPRTILAHVSMWFCLWPRRTSSGLFA